MTADPTEHDDLAPQSVQTRRVLIAAGAFVALLAGSLAAMVGFYAWQAPSRRFTPPQTFPEPRLFVNQKEELNSLLAAQRRRLEGERKGTQIVAIPIEQAMEIIAKRGAEAYAPIGAQPAPQQAQKTQPAPPPEKPAQTLESAKPAVQAGAPPPHPTKAVHRKRRGHKPKR